MKWPCWITLYTRTHCVARGLRPLTLAAYEDALKQFSEWTRVTRSDRPPDQVTARDVLEYLQHLREDRGNGDSAVNRALVVLRSFCRAMVAMARSFRLAGSFKFTGGLLLGLGTAVDIGRVRRHELTLGVAGRNFGFGAATFLGGPFVVIGVGYGLIDNFYTGGVDAFVDDSTRYYVSPKFPISPY